MPQGFIHWSSPLGSIESPIIGLEAKLSLTCQVHVETTCSWLLSKCPVPPTAIIPSADEFLPCFIHQASGASWHYASCCVGARRQRLDCLRQPPSWSPMSRRSTPALQMWIAMTPANWAKASIPCPISQKSCALAKDWKGSLRWIQTLPTSWCSNPQSQSRCDLWEKVISRQRLNLISPCCQVPVYTWKRCIFKEKLRPFQVVNPKCHTSNLWIVLLNLQHLIRNSWQCWSWMGESRIHLHGGAGWWFGMQRWPSRSMAVTCTVALSWNKVVTSTSWLPTTHPFTWKVRVSSWSTSPLTFSWKRFRSMPGGMDNSTATLHSTWCSAGPRFTWQALLSTDQRFKSKNLWTSFWMSEAPPSSLMAKRP